VTEDRNMIGITAAPAALLKLIDIPDADPTQSLLELIDRRCWP
jgi:hypothetical protein